MTVLPLAEVRANLSRIVDEAMTTHERTEITRNGVRAAVVLSAADYDAIVETLDVLGDAALLRDIRTSLAESSADNVLTTDDVLTGPSPGRRPLPR